MRITSNFRFTLVVACLGKDTSATPVGCNRILLKPKESSWKLIGISFSDRNRTFQTERDDANDGAVAYRCVLKGFIFKIYKFS